MAIPTSADALLLLLMQLLLCCCCASVVTAAPAAGLALSFVPRYIRRRFDPFDPTSAPDCPHDAIYYLQQNYRSFSE